VLVNDEEAKRFTTDSFEELKLLDPITEDRSTLRYSVLSSLYKTYEYNKARNLKDVCIYEIGKGFFKKDDEYGENSKLAFLMTGEYYTGISNKKDVDFYVIKGIAEEMLDFLGYANRYSFIHSDVIPKEMHPYQTALISVNNDVVGIIGKLHPKFEKEPVYVCEINLDKLLDKRTGKMKFKEISKFPSIKKDLAFVMDKNIESKTVEDVIKKSGGSLLDKIEVFDVYTGENVAENEKSIAYSLTFMDAKRTLNEEEVLEIMQKIIDAVQSKCDAKLR
jgi:phenylalanyl-tRNA synthetase beta chain